MKHLIFFAIVTLACFSGQESYAQRADTGSLVIIGDPRIDSLLALHYKINTQYPVFPGYRVQIFFESGNNSKTLAREAIEKFNEEYPDASAYLIFESPYYKVRAGDFRTRMEAESFLDVIQKDYPSAFVTRDNINFPELETADGPESHQ